MDVRAGATTVHFAEHGTGIPVLILHGAGVDHREVEACFEPIFGNTGSLRRIYPDLPGMGHTIATDDVRSAEDVLDVLLGFARRVADDSRYLLIGHSAGAYFAQAMAARHPEQVAGLALICPLLPASRDVPEHRVVLGSAEVIGDEQFRNYFVIHTPQMLERYERYVAPGAALADQTALARIAQQWELAAVEGTAYEGPTLIVAGKLDSTIGYSAAVDLVEHYRRGSVAVLDDAGHALPHERPDVLRALTADWLVRVHSHHA